MILRYFQMIVFMTILSGCVTQGGNFPSETSWIRKEKTTQDQVRMMLGKPSAVGDSGGTRTWTYGYYEYRIAKPAKYKELKFFWDQNGQVKHYSFNSSFPKDLKRYGRS
ncbi:MAG: outer membrane protein assembly factor BamE [Oligoflexales bacterium]